MNEQSNGTVDAIEHTTTIIILETIILSLICTKHLTKSFQFQKNP